MMIAERLPRLVFAALCGLAAASVQALELDLSIAAVRHPLFGAESIAVRLARDGSAQLTIATLKAGDFVYRGLELSCGEFHYDAKGIRCQRGELRRAHPRRGDRPPLPFEFAWQAASGRIEFTIREAEAQTFSPLIRRLRAWSPRGRADLRVIADRRQVGFDLSLRGLGFGNQEGSVAAENMTLALSAQATKVGERWHWQAEAHWPQGELYLAPWYRRAGIRAQGEGWLDDAALTVDLAQLDIAGVGAVSTGLTFDRASGKVANWGLVSDRLNLAAAMREWGQPWLDAQGGMKLDVAGFVRFAVEGDEAGVRHAYLGLEQARLAEASGRFAFDDLGLTFPWARGEATVGELQVGAGRLGALPLGRFALPLQLAGNTLRLSDLAIPLLDGRLRIDELTAERNAAGWQGKLSGGLEGLSVPQLAQALGLPLMAGTVTARVSSARWQGREIAFEGGLDIAVFDGQLTVRHLRLVDLLLPTQRLLADVTARQLDFGMLTGTFDFGSIEGRFDIDIEGLELQQGRPLAFTARVHDSPGHYRKTLSRSALRDISSLGGIAAATAVQASPAALFNSFDYARLGFTARLSGDVLQLDGLEPVAGGGFLLIDGAGLPRVRVIGYNRRIDWLALVARLAAVAAGKTRAVFE